VRPAQSIGAALLVARPAGMGKTLFSSSQLLPRLQGRGEERKWVIPVLMSPNMCRISSLAHNSGIRPHGTISIELMHTVRLVILFALLALQTRVALRANSDSLSRFYERNFGAYTECRANNFCFS
jgi:hypothetical protein